MIDALGTIAAFAGIFWFLWDRNASTPGWLLGIAIVCLVGGGAL